MEKMNINDFMNYVRDSYQSILNKDNVVLDDLEKTEDRIHEYIIKEWYGRITFDQLCELSTFNEVYYNMTYDNLKKCGKELLPYRKKYHTEEYFKIRFVIDKIKYNFQMDEEDFTKVILEYCSPIWHYCYNSFKKKEYEGIFIYLSVLLTNIKFKKLFYKEEIE